MSNALAIAGVTASMRRILIDAQIGFVTTLPPDKAAIDTHNERVNLFLYHTQTNAAWRNREMPGQVRQGETGFPPLALNLYYLVTAFGDEGTSLLDQRLLGRAASALHDQPVLDPEFIKQALEDVSDPVLGRADLDRQVERVRIIPQAMNLEEMSKLWATFQTPYRVSMAYEASVVLIESKRATRTPLPVTSRGKGNRGWATSATLGPRVADLEYRDPRAVGSPKYSAATFPRRGESNMILALHGVDFPSQGAKLVIRDPRQPFSGNDVVARIDPLPGSSGDQLLFAIDPKQASARWVSGLLTLSVEYPFLVSENPEVIRTRSTSAVPLAMAPVLRLNSSGKVLAVPSTSPGLVSVRCDPPVGPDRQVSLLLDREGVSLQLPAKQDARDATPETPTFDVSDVPSNTYRVRLRVDGVDSLLERATSDGGLFLDDSQTVEL